MYDQISGRMSQASFNIARNRGMRNQVWSTVTRRRNGLLSLGEVVRKCLVAARRHAGIRTVPIACIRGSESRCRDFDRDFNPLQTHTADRWMSVARARREGKALPPVDLVKVGNVYFVLDGHHRISVARTLGQLDIEAKVTEWKVDGALPWEDAGANGSPTGAEPRSGGVSGRFGGVGSRIANRVVVGLRGLVSGGAT